MAGFQDSLFVYERTWHLFPLWLFGSLQALWNNTGSHFWFWNAPVPSFSNIFSGSWWTQVDTGVILKTHTQHYSLPWFDPASMRVDPAVMLHLFHRHRSMTQEMSKTIKLCVLKCTPLFKMHRRVDDLFVHMRHAYMGWGTCDSGVDILL